MEKRGVNNQNFGIFLSFFRAWVTFLIGTLAKITKTITKKSTKLLVNKNSPDFDDT